MSNPKQEPTPGATVPTAAEKPAAGAGTPGPGEKPKLDAEAVRNLFERAAERVKPLIQKELECEVIGSDIWNLRLRASER